MSTATEINPKFLDHLRHMLGARPDHRKSIHGYRNHFCAYIGGDHFNDMKHMESLGLVTAGQVINSGRDQYFHATLSGCNAIKLHKAAIKRAFED